MKIGSIIISLCLFGLQIQAQVNLNDSTVAANIITVELGYVRPAADLADRFGGFGTVGAGYQYKSKNNWITAFTISYLYGTSIKEDTILNSIKNESGYVIGNDGLLYQPILYMQGLNFTFQTGKITNLFAINPNSGLTFLAGFGLLQHNMLIYIDETYVPQLDKDYRKGYDRLSNGFQLNQYIGYYLFNNKYFVNFRAGFEFTEAFTKNRRNFNFDTQAIDNAARLDLMVAFKVSWNLPVYTKPERRFYTY